MNKPRVQSKKSHRFLSMLLSAAMLLGTVQAAGLWASAAEEPVAEPEPAVQAEEVSPYTAIGEYGTFGDFEYYVQNDGTAEITDYTGDEAEVVIPSEIDGYKVMAIGAIAFQYSDITSVTIPESIMHIGIESFYGCANLEEINLPEHEMMIEPNAFLNTAYSNNINNWENDWLVIGKHRIVFAFRYEILENNTANITGYYSPEKEVIIPSEIDGYRVTKINESAFSSEDITRVTIPENIVSIGDSAFDNCRSLQEIILPNSEITMGTRVFAHTAYASQLENWRGDYLYIGERQVGYAFDYGIRSDGSVSIYSYDSPRKEVIIPSEIENSPVSAIMATAFRGNTNITSVVVPEGVVSIGISAFQDCSSLVSITLPAGITSIDSHAFSGTAYAKDINNWKGDSLYIGDYEVMKSCNYYMNSDNTANLYEYNKPAETLTIPSEIDGYMITSITDGYVADWGPVGGPFANAVENIIIPENIRNVNFAFYGNTSLKNIEVEENNPNYSSKNGVLFNKDQTELVYYPAANEETSYTVPNTVTSIAYGSFVKSISLESISIPSNVKSIDSNSFINSSITTIYGESGSYAEAFALENGYEFIPIKIEIIPLPDSDIVLTETDNGAFISNLQPGSTVADLTAQLEESDLRITDKNGNPLEADDPIGTGCVVSCYAGEEVVSQATVVVFGDTTGDGRINVQDISRVQNHLLNLEQLDTISESAVRFGREQVDVSALLTVSAHVLQMKDIDQGLQIQ